MARMSHIPDTDVGSSGGCNSSLRLGRFPELGTSAKRNLLTGSSVVRILYQLVVLSDCENVVVFDLVPLSMGSLSLFSCPRPPA